MIESNREIIFMPAWDRTNPDPSKDYGISDVMIYFLLHGKKGIVEFQLGSGWHLMIVEDRREQYARDRWWDTEMRVKDVRRMAYPYDVCYWSEVRLSDDDTEFEDGVERVFSKRPCFYGYRPYPASEEAYQALVTKGESGIWEYLENYYCEVFGC